MNRHSKHEQELYAESQAEAESAVAATETDDAFVDPDESLESDEEPG